MVITRVQWDELDGRIRQDIHREIGPVLRAETVAAGFNSELAAVVHTADGRRYFVKGLRTSHPSARGQEREKRINPYVRGLSARLLWSLESAGWSLLGFEYLEGEHASYGPGSADLALVAEAMAAVGEITCPDVPVKFAEQRWSAYTDGDALLFRGNALLHTEWNPTNTLIVRAPAPHARVVDWAWPTRGAAWIDPACWVVWLIAGGHTPSQAEQWAAKVPAWSTATGDHLAAFALVQARLWEAIRQASPSPWEEQLACAAAEWAQHRGRSRHRLTRSSAMKVTRKM
ncbi:aminoglycoside phosphotransferase [Streptomyces xiamenensis]|uniref:aminoglycoside phosphotransferase n=1 Tax=Streptomyces xiamenensis TaxID=408015 RepID=UPI0036E4472D